MSSKTSSGGIGVAGVLTIIFFVLKVLNVQPVADWSWFWVFSPIIFSIALVVFIVILIAIIAAIFGN